MPLSKSHHLLSFACGNPSRTQPGSLALCGSLFSPVRQRKSLFLRWHWWKRGLFSWASKMAECLPLDYQNSSTGTKAPGRLSEWTGMVLMCSPFSPRTLPHSRQGHSETPSKPQFSRFACKVTFPLTQAWRSTKDRFLPCQCPASLLNPALSSPEHALLILLKAVP